MPKANKKTGSKKFDPRDKDSSTNVEETPKMTPSNESNQGKSDLQQALSVIATLTSQVQGLTTQVQALSDSQSKTDDNVEKFRRETAEQKIANLAKVDAQRKSKRRIMKEKWDKQEKVAMFVPYEGNEKKGSRMPVQANGYSYIHTDGFVGVPKGSYVQVPKGVFDIVSESLGQQIENMGYDSRIDTREVNADGGKFDPEKLIR